MDTTKTRENLSLLRRPDAISPRRVKQQPDDNETKASKANKKMRFRPLAAVLLAAPLLVAGFSPIPRVPQRTTGSFKQRTVLFRSELPSTPNDETEEEGPGPSQVVIRGSPEDPLSEEAWDNLEAGKPSQWMVIKEVCVCAHC